MILPVSGVYHITAEMAEENLKKKKKVLKMAIVNKRKGL